MTDENNVDKAKSGQRILHEKVDEYKRAHPERLPELDYAFLLQAIKRVNEDSLVKIARNAFNEKREWIPGTETWNVSKVYLSDDHCVTFTVSRTDKAMSVQQLLDELDAINKKLPLKNVPVKIELGPENVIQATDLYAHSLVSSMWAGLPVDFVLCFNQKLEKKPAPETESDD